MYLSSGWQEVSSDPFKVVTSRTSTIPLRSRSGVEMIMSLIIHQTEERNSTTLRAGVQKPSCILLVIAKLTDGNVQVSLRGGVEVVVPLVTEGTEERDRVGDLVGEDATGRRFGRITKCDSVGHVLSA